MDTTAAGVTLEDHKPGNGHTYRRLRAARGQKLANGNRTMALKPEGEEQWAEKIYTRNQQAKLAQCLTLVEQAAAIAETVSWEFEPSLCSGEQR